MNNNASMIYSQQTTKTAQTYAINEKDVLFCQLIAGGANRGEAYYITYIRNAKTVVTIEAATEKANELIKATPGMSILITKLKQKKLVNSQAAKNEVKDALNEKNEEELNEEEIKKFTDKSYIIGRLARISEGLRGKEQADVLNRIADLQRMKNDEVAEKDEKRRFYLPFVSNCRTCKVMDLFKAVLDSKK